MQKDSSVFSDSGSVQVSFQDVDIFWMRQGVTDVTASGNMGTVYEESQSDRRDCIRKYEYSLQGKPLVTHRLLVRGP